MFNDKKYLKGGYLMKIALLHFSLVAGPLEKNLQKLCWGIETAAENGAKWIITPEMALQGYYMNCIAGNYQPVSENSSELEPLKALAKKYQLTIFLGCAELTAKQAYNACLVIDASGEIIARHYKIRTLNWITEAWSTPGDSLEVVEIAGVRVGLLVCADAWFAENAAVLAQKAAQLIVVVAAWPPGCGGPPEAAWKRCSQAASNIPVVVCNQTGRTEKLDLTIAQSAVVVADKIITAYQGEAEKILYVQLPADLTDPGNWQTVNFELAPGNCNLL